MQMIFQLRCAVCAVMPYSSSVVMAIAINVNKEEQIIRRLWSRSDKNVWGSSLLPLKIAVEYYVYFENMGNIFYFVQRLLRFFGFCTII